MRVCYLGPLFDHSGYGEANRNAVAALHKAGVQVVAKAVSYTTESSDHGPIGQLVRTLTEQKGTYKIKILHTTPDQYSKFMEPGKYHIGHFFWETDNLSEEFASGLKLMDEIWTGSQANVDAIRNAGVRVPVFIYPQAIDTETKWPQNPYKIKEFKEGYKFYSIFEWTDRKNPETLLNAYWQAFEGRDDVCLIIKTYFRNFTHSNKKQILNSIARLKSKSGIKNFPKVFLYLDLMDRQHILRLHETGDCFVSPHRGEGWGLPAVEAALAGNAVITTGYGGVGEYVDNPLPFKMVPLKGMAHSSRWYTKGQNWADVDIEDVKKQMLLAVNGKIKPFDTNQFSYERVGKMMAKRLKTIEGKL